MTPRTTLLLAILAAACGSRADDAPAASSRAQAAPDTRPNVLYVISDDQTYDTLGVAGHPLLETPNLDRIAASGVRFTNAFVTTSVCSPARASFLTGRYVRNHGVLDNSTSLPADLPTFASVLRDAGYATGYFGKWHMGTQGERPGFQRSLSYLGQGSYRNCPFHVNGTTEVLQENGFVDDLATKYAIEWMTEDRQRPFLACVGFKATHGPREPQRRYDELFADAEFPTPPNGEALPPWPRPRELDALADAAGVDPADLVPDDDWAANLERTVDEGEATTGKGMRDYLRLIAGLDHEVGRLLDALEEHGLAENTIVVFVSDNGYLHGNHGSIGKRAAYEESMRVVMLVRDPRAPAGLVRDELVLNVDVAPTLLELAGVPAPAGMDGRSLAPLIRGGQVDWRKDFLYEYFRHKRYPVPTMFAVRTETEKLVRYPAHPSWEELFDLRADPYETRNLAADPKHATDLRQLRARLEALEREVGPRPKE